MNLEFIIFSIAFSYFMLSLGCNPLDLLQSLESFAAINVVADLPLGQDNTNKSIYLYLVIID